MQETLKPYFGEFHHAMDEKNRVTVPAPWRAATEGEVFFTIPNQSLNCLVVLPPAEFSKVEQTVQDNPEIDAAQRRSFVRKFYSMARQVVTDRQGRILVPDEHRGPVGLQDSVVLVGGLNRFEIWDPGRWQLVSTSEMAVYQQVSNLLGL